MKNKCYIISAGDCTGINFIKKENDYVIAADGGYKYAKDNGIQVDMVLGDFDSLGYIPKEDNVIIHNTEKDDTDTLLAIKEGEKKGYQEFVIYGALGGNRMDHSIANISCLIYLARRGMKGIILDDKTSITAVSDGKVELPKKENGYFSVFSFTRISKGVTITNAKYNVNAYELANEFPIGVSNEFIGESPVISVDDGDLIIIW